jgi:hypothetical protein
MGKRVNIPNKKDRFENVEFVNDMTPHQMKVMISNLFENFHELANKTECLYPDVANVVDAILDGRLWKDKDLNPRYRYTIINNGQILCYDPARNQFQIRNIYGDTTSFRGISKKTLMVKLKEAGIKMDIPE